MQGFPDSSAGLYIAYGILYDREICGDDESFLRDVEIPCVYLIQNKTPIMPYAQESFRALY